MPPARTAGASAALFRRTLAGAKPTDACRALMIDAADILQRMRALEQRLVDVCGRQDNNMRIGAGGIAADTCVLSAAAAMIGACPAVRVHLAAMNWINVLKEVRERQVELGILELTELGKDTADLVIEPLLRHQGFFAIRAGHSLAGRDRVTLTEILSFPFVFLENVPTRIIGPMAAAREAARANGPIHATFPAMVHENPIAALQVTMQSDAVVAVTAPIAATALRGGGIIILPWHEPWLMTNFGVVQVRGRRVSAGAAGFIGLLREADRNAFSLGQEVMAQIRSAGACG